MTVGKDDEKAVVKLQTAPRAYFVYLLRCADESLYTGITTDVERRFAEHLTGGRKGAKYTGSHTPKEIEAVWKVENRSGASKLEWRLKHLTKQQKEAICKEPERLSEFVTVEEVGYAEVVRGDKRGRYPLK